MKIIIIIRLCAQLMQVEVNILTGETKILQADIVYDCGQSMNPAVDMGQVFVFVLTLYSIIYIH